MSTKKLSKLQKWILVRAKEGPDSYNGGHQMVLMVRVICEFYGVETYWQKRAEKFGLFGEPSVKQGRRNFKGVNVNSQRASVSRAFRTLEARGLGWIVQGTTGWSGFELTDAGMKTVKGLSETDTLLTVSHEVGR